MVPALLRSLSTMIALSLFAPLTAGAQGRKPPPPPPKHEKKSTTVTDVRDSADAALSEFSHGLHQAAGEAKKGANQALQAVDDTVHGKKK